MLSDLADYVAAAWIMEADTWRFVFDSSDGESVIQHHLLGVSQWRISDLRDGIGVMEIRLVPVNGALEYTIVTVCNETIEVICADVRETVIKHPAPHR